MSHMRKEHCSLIFFLSYGTGTRFLFHLLNLIIAISPIAPNVYSLVVPNVMLASLFFWWFVIKYQQHIHETRIYWLYTCHSSMFYVYLRFVFNFSPFMLHNKYNVYTHRCSLVQLNYLSCCVIFIPFLKENLLSIWHKVYVLGFTVHLVSLLHMPEFLHWYNVLLPCRPLKVAIE